MCRCLPGYTGHNCSEAVSCQFWDMVEGHFSTDGCAPMEGVSGYVACSCTHLTAFAAIRFPVPIQAPSSPINGSGSMNPSIPMSHGIGSPIIIIAIILAILMQAATLGLATYRRRRYLSSLRRKARIERLKQRRARMLERAETSGIKIFGAASPCTPRQADANEPATVAGSDAARDGSSLQFFETALGQRLRALRFNANPQATQRSKLRMPLPPQADGRAASRFVLPVIGPILNKNPIRIAPRPKSQQTRLTSDSPLSIPSALAPAVSQEIVPALSPLAVHDDDKGTQECTPSQCNHRPLAERTTASNAVMSCGLTLHSLETSDPLAGTSVLTTNWENTAGNLVNGDESPPPPSLAAHGLEVPAVMQEALSIAPVPNERILAPRRPSRKPDYSSPDVLVLNPPPNLDSLPADESPSSWVVPVITRPGSARAMSNPTRATTAFDDDPSHSVQHSRPSVERIRVSDRSTYKMQSAPSGFGSRARPTAMGAAARPEVGCWYAWWTMLRTEHSIISAAYPLRGAAVDLAYVLRDAQAVQVFWIQVHAAAAILALILAPAEMSTASTFGEALAHAAFVLGPSLIIDIIFRLVFRVCNHGPTKRASSTVAITVSSAGASPKRQGGYRNRIVKRGRIEFRERSFVSWSYSQVAMAWALAFAFQVVCIAATIGYTLPLTRGQAGAYIQSVVLGLVLTWIVAEPALVLGLLGLYTALRRIAAHASPDLEDDKLDDWYPFKTPILPDDNKINVSMSQKE